MNSYTVTVKITMLEHYDVDAETPEDAAENWQDGQFIGSDDSCLDAEAIRVRRGSTTVWSKP
jgi:hypothetical protein